MNGLLHIAQILLQSGANVNVSAKLGIRPLQLACKKGNMSIVQLLVRNGTDVHFCNENGVRPFDVACGTKHQTIADFFFRKRCMCPLSGIKCTMSFYNQSKP